MYCSIQEAWGTDFGNSSSNNSALINENFEEYKTKKKHKKRKDQTKNYIENFQNPNNSYQQNSQTFTRKENNRDPPFVIQEDNSEFERGTNYIEGDNKNRYSFTRGLSRLPDHNGPEFRNIQEEKENVYQQDNYEEEEMVETEKNLQNKEIYQEENSNLYKSNHNLSFLLDKINILIDKFDNKGENNNTNIIMFVLTGIFIIFVLESVFKFGKYLRE